MTDQFETYRPLLFSIAYRMLGSAMEAEDIVQDAYLRYSATPPETIQSHRAFLTTITTRLCLNQLESARVKRETYLGPWLPEPVVTVDDTSLLPEQHVNAYESISMAFLVLLEQLTPLERAVFLLREVFDYGYGEIAGMLGKEEAACRKLYSRAKQHVSENRPRFERSPEQHQQFLDQFMQVVETGELNGLMSLLAEDVVLYTDGGGKVTAATHPIYGNEAVAKFMLGTTRFLPTDHSFGLSEINGEPAVIVRYGQRVGLVIVLKVVNNRIAQAHIIANPDKLQRL